MRQCGGSLVALVLVAGLAAACSTSREAAEEDPDFKPLEVAHEIVDGGTILTDPTVPLPTYKSAEDPANPGHEIGDEEWADYEPPRPYLKNTTRNLQFDESAFIASPGEPDGLISYVQTSDGFTWAAMSTAVSAMWPYDPADYSGLAARDTYYAGSLVLTPGPGIVKVTANFKAQKMKFYANEGGVSSGTPGAVKLDRYRVTDEWGNVYVMHASAQDEPAAVAAAFADAVLPVGWTRETVQLADDLVLEPARGADGSYHYLIFRDSADNTYHQIGWGESGVSLAAQVEGLPIWGGEAGDRLVGDVGGVRDDLLHGAGGDDLLVPGAGDDVVWGDAGLDTVVLPGKRADYTLAASAGHPTRLTLSGPGHTKTLHHVERLQFDDETVSTEALAARAREGAPERP